MNAYVGIFFKPKNNGIICFYNPNEHTPRFWYIQRDSSASFICKNMLSYIDKNCSSIHVHINDNKITKPKQLALYNQVIGMLDGVGQFRDIKTRIVSKEKIQNRIMNLLSIKTKKEFVSKMKTKKMHNNQYNLVYEMVKMQSRQSINAHLDCYLLSYYGFLKDKINSYNHKEY
jgi:uncharacterized membrane-anchored protein YjiN (DUF445 family)